MSSETLKKLDEAIALVQQLGAGPMPKDAFVEQAWTMANAHGMYLIGLRNIYQKAPTIQPKDYDDFVGYGLIWCAAIHEHHTIEEEWYIDALKGAVAKDTIVHEHDEFKTQLHEIEQYFISCLPAGKKYGVEKAVAPANNPHTPFDGQHLVKLIDTLAVGFVPHFVDEITYLDAEKLRASEKVTYQDLKAIDARFKKEIPNAPAALHVYAVLHRSSPHFPPAPWFIVNIIIPWVFYWPNRRNWRFAPPQIK